MTDFARAQALNALWPGHASFKLTLRSEIRHDLIVAVESYRSASGFSGVPSAHSSTKETPQ